MPPENQEWFISPLELETHQPENDELKQVQQEVAAEESPFGTDNMLPYLFPTSLFAEEEEAVKRRTAGNWGGYNNATYRQESLRQWQESIADINQEPTTAPMATTSKEATVVQQTNALNSLGRYVIPKISKLGVQSNKANELAAKVSPPARAILPKPPGTDHQNPCSLWNTRGLRPQKKKK